jgi:formylglycine-generating enzyme required for sulfatase activity
MLSPNTILQGRYRIIRHLGRGGMGAVYEALNERVSSVVALKETLAETEAQREAFEQEAKRLANLDHDAFPRVMDHFFEGDGQYLVMELIRGNDLAELLKLRESPFAPAKVLEWADQLLDALEELHSYPIIHRDIKPSNLKLTRKGKIKLLDFGIAKGAAGQMTTLKTDHSGGGYTPHYAPLEQTLRADRRWSESLSIIDAEAVERIQQKTTDPRSDLYALGATLYHLMTGVIPPDAPTRALSVWTGKPDRLRPACELNPQVPPAVSSVLMQAMALERHERPATATQLRRMLREAVNDPLSVPPTALSPELEEQARQRREAQEHRRAEEEQARRRAEEEARQRAEAEAREKREAREAARRAAEEERKRLEEAETARRIEEEQRRREEAERRQREAEQERAEEESRHRAAEEAERRRIEEAQRREEDERLRLEVEEATRRRVAEEQKQHDDPVALSSTTTASSLTTAETLKPTASPAQSAQAPATLDTSTVETVNSELTSKIALTDADAASSDDAAVLNGRKGAPTGRRAWLLIGLAAIGLTLVLVFALRLGDKVRQQTGNANKSSDTQPPPVQTGAPLIQTGAPPVPPEGMVYVPGGTFRMGRDTGDKYESPAYTQTVNSFFVDLHEVTQREYAVFIMATGLRAPSGWIYGTYDIGNENKPVTGVNWNNAKAYCEWAGKKLPTEEEWEYAARGPEGRLYPWGDEWLQGYANANGEQKEVVDVGRYRGATPLGVVDMVGNAWEWTASTLKAYPGGKLPGEAAGKKKVVRGGNFKSETNEATTTYRMGLVPTDDSSGYKTTGFRCVKNVD